MIAKILLPKDHVILVLAKNSRHKINIKFNILLLEVISYLVILKDKIVIKDLVLVLVGIKSFLAIL
jgi:hypothetical protein